MMFVLRMAVRETRASWQRLLFFFICIAVGVAAIVALRSVIQSVREVFTGEAKTFMASDVLISSNREWSDVAKAAIDRRLAEAGVQGRTELIETPTMVRPVDGQPLVKMAELRAIQNTFPLYGAFKLQNDLAYSHSLLENHGAIVRPELLTSLGVKQGDRIAIGVGIFTIRAVLITEPGSNTGFSLGPRVLIDYADLPSTGLLSFGSRAGRFILAKVPDNQIERLVTGLREDLRNQFAGARSFKSTEDQIGRDFDRAENYLSLVGLIIVILGGIAVSSVTRVFIQQKMRAIAVLKCVGARSQQVIAVYVLQVLALGLAGSLLGVAIARAAVAAIPLALGPTSTSVLATVKYGISWSAALQGTGIGVLVSLLFSIAPLLHVRFIKPSLLLRDESVRRKRIDWLGIGVLVMVAAGLVGDNRLAGGVAADRADCLRRFCRSRGDSALRRTRAGCPGQAARQFTVVPAAARGAAFVTPRKPDAGDSAGRRARRVLHRRRPHAAGDPARRVFGADRCRFTRHVHARHSTEPGRCGAGVSG